MTVHFIGAGPGAADLLTLRGRDLIAASPVCLYAGSLVPEGVLAHCPKGCQIVNTAAMSLASRSIASRSSSSVVNLDSACSCICLSKNCQRARPAYFARYSAESASRRRESGVDTGVDRAIPMDADGTMR